LWIRLLPLLDVVERLRWMRYVGPLGWGSMGGGPIRVVEEDEAESAEGELIGELAVGDGGRELGDTVIAVVGGGRRVVEL
jgi:hypothetical protein